MTCDMSATCTKERRLVLLDRDGTIIVERHYLSDPCQVELIPGVAEGLRQLSQKGLGLVVITNQSGIGRGFFDKARLILIHQRLCELLAAERVQLDGIYYCPHVPEDECPCRKPQPGLLEQAKEQLNFDPHAAFVIGDKPCDVELGQRVGATTFLIRTGYGAQFAAEACVTPDYIVEDMREAAQVIEQLLASNHGRTTNATKL
jgi:D-glycero-D-manno-heptose 1,7-bisphosphate phosphatase